MGVRVQVDRDAVARVARQYGVRHLHLFGSAISDRFDPQRSDIDILVDFRDGAHDPFEAYFGLRDDLERLFGRPVDLVVASALRNPFIRQRVLSSAEELYAA